MIDKKATKKWFNEAARICRVAAGAPSVILALAWGGNSVLAMLGKSEILHAVEDLASVNLPSIALAAINYVLLSVLATWLEIKADRIDDRIDDPRIILPGEVDQCGSKRSRPGGDSS